MVGGSNPPAGSRPSNPTVTVILKPTQLLALAALALVAMGCSVTYTKKDPNVAYPLNLPSPTAPIPSPANVDPGNVACATDVAPAAPAYGGFGARIADFNAAHKSGAPEIRCSTDQHVIVIQLDLNPATSAAAAVAAAKRELPDDLVTVYDKTYPTCRDLQFTSAKLAAALGADDPSGAVNVELESTLAVGFKYDPNQVDTALFHSDETPGQSLPCTRGTT